MSNDTELLPLIEAVAKVVTTKYSPSTIWRWAHRGFSNSDGTRTKLAVQYCGKSPKTTVQAVKEFMAKITAAKGSTLAENKSHKPVTVKPDESGTAFPETRPSGYGTTAGLTKREYFVAAILSNSAICHSGLTNQERAITAVELADAVVELLNFEEAAQ